MTMFSCGPCFNWWGHITSNYGVKRTNSIHDGIDIGIPIGTDIVAVHSGRIRVSEYQNSGFGEVIVIENIELETTYAHLSRRDCQVGDLITEGTVIGLSGNTGNSTGPHLHFGLRIKPWEYGGEMNGYSDPTFALLSILTS